MFDGEDTSSHLGLWITDGTVAGTSEVQVAGASSSGLFNSGLTPDFTVLGGKALFAGSDAKSNYSLWVTDGTSAGTSELTSASAYSSGLFYFRIAPDITVLNGTEAVFEGEDTLDHLNLWVTNGTSAGKSEADHGRGVLRTGCSISITPPPSKLISRRSATRCCLSAKTARRRSASITNGTSAGTSELTAAGANAKGLFYNGSIQVFPDLTVLGTEALFAGLDANGHIGLWVTNGTSAGTSGLTVTGAVPSGLFYNNGPVLDPDFTVIGGQALFEGV